MDGLHNNAGYRLPSSTLLTTLCGTLPDAAVAQLSGTNPNKPLLAVASHSLAQLRTFVPNQDIVLYSFVFRGHNMGILKPPLMFPVQNVFSLLSSYRLGYTLQRPYPWRWATPSIVVGFLVMSAFLTLLNIPLAAYEIVQEATYRPNDTLPPLLFSSLVPGLLQSPETSFAPQILTVGETLVVNGSIFNFTIAGAWDENKSPVMSFSYYNNPFSDGCDITRVFSVDRGNTETPITKIAFSNLSALSVTVVPCCDCENDPQSTGSNTPLPTELPCRREVTHLVGSQVTFQKQSGEGGTLPGSSSSVLFDLGSTQSIGIYSNYFNQPWVNDAVQNVLQALYHLARLELGIILENQIFASPAMFNQTISAIYIPPTADLEGYENYQLNQSRTSTSNATLMNQWMDIVNGFNTTDRVPVISYLRPVPRLKPLGSAVTSVFVSTFAMVSVLWTIFSLLAGVIAARAEGADVPSMEDRIGTYGVALYRVELSVRMIQLALKKRGLFEEDDDEDGLMEAASADPSTSHHVDLEKSTLLTHRRQPDTQSAVWSHSEQMV
ncbi:hypothetical protein C8R46DRAFT_1026746 [Mycena filopes]|nr:hypothetical protein C8R46DRAFT_1026746 [Mycena filopes]